MTFKTHYFYSTGEAYDKSQTGYYRIPKIAADADVLVDYNDYYIEVADGDLLVVPEEGVYGFLHDAWPIAYVPDPPNGKSGEFHQLVGNPEEFLKSYPKYVKVYEAAMELYRLHHKKG
jgi:hypothetical protein